MIRSLFKEHAGKKKGLLALLSTMERLGEGDAISEIEDFPAEPVDLGLDGNVPERAAKR